MCVERGELHHCWRYCACDATPGLLLLNLSRREQQRLKPLAIEWFLPLTSLRNSRVGGILPCFQNHRESPDIHTLPSFLRGKRSGQRFRTWICERLTVMIFPASIELGSTTRSSCSADRF